MLPMVRSCMLISSSPPFILVTLSEVHRWSGIITVLSLFVLAQLIASPLASLFVGYDPALFELTRMGFRIYCFAFLINGFNIYGSAFFTALNNGLLSALISFLRTLVFQMAAILILPLIFGINGIWYSITVAELLTLCVTATFIVRKRNTYHYF